MTSALKEDPTPSTLDVADPSQNRLRILKNDGVVQLYGVLSDNSNLLALSELISKKNEPIDLSNLIRATWNGLLVLNTKLRSIYGDNQIVIRGVPFGVYRHLKLLPEFKTFYHVESMELGFLSVGSSDGHISIKKAMVETKDIGDIAAASVKGFAASAKEGLGRVFGRLDFAVPTDALHINSGAEIMPAEEDFWYRYYSFATTSISLSEDLSDSLGLSVSGLLREVALEIAGLESGLRVLEPGYSSKSSHAIDQGGALFLQRSKSLSDKIVETTALCDESMGELENLLTDGSPSRTVAQVRLVCSKICHSILISKTYLHEIENLGVILADALTVVNNTLVRGKKLIHDRESLDPDDLTHFRENLDIMDPLSEDDWEATREIALERLSLVDEHCSKAITLLQGFDLLRQILEHRISESETILAGFAQSLSWEDLKHSVYEMVRKKLVTDQEKYACDFFTPEAASQDEESKKPGDMLFF